jgi:hypothetical protein
MMPMSRDAALIQAAAKQMAQHAAVAMERAGTRCERAQARQLERAAAWLKRSIADRPAHGGLLQKWGLQHGKAERGQQANIAAEREPPT